MKRILAVGTTFFQCPVHFIHRNRDNRRVLLLATLTPNGHDAILNRSSHGIAVFRFILEIAVCICKILGAFLLLMWYNMSRRGLPHGRNAVSLSGGLRRIYRQSFCIAIIVFFAWQYVIIIVITVCICKYGYYYLLWDVTDNREQYYRRFLLR